MLTESPQNLTIMNVHLITGQAMFLGPSFIFPTFISSTRMFYVDPCDLQIKVGTAQGLTLRQALLFRTSKNYGLYADLPELRAHFQYFYAILTKTI